MWPVRVSQSTIETGMEMKAGAGDQPGSQRTGSTLGVWGSPF